MVARNGFSETAKDAVTRVGAQLRALPATYRAAGVSGVTVALMSIPNVTAFAEEAAAGSNALDGEAWTIITGAFSNLAITATAVIALGVTTAVGVVTMAAGSKYAIKWIRGVFSNAA